MTFPLQGWLTLVACAGELALAWIALARGAPENALRRAADNRTLAARRLGISRRALYNKLAEQGLA